MSMYNNVENNNVSNSNTAGNASGNNVANNNVSNGNAAGNNVAKGNMPNGNAACNGNNGTKAEAKKKRCFSVKTAKEIQDSKGDQRNFLIDGLITFGLNLLAAPRKKGKSWLALQIALCIAGWEAFWGRMTVHGKVLYFALEDNEKRLQSRINKQLDDADAPSRLLVSYSSGRTGNGFFKDLDDYLNENKDVVLVIVDVMQKIRSEKRSSQTEYGHDYTDVGALKKIADDHNIALLAITHTRKTRDSRDRLNDIAGGVGVTGAADTILMISGDGGSADKDNVLSIIGRDVAEEELTIHFNKDTCKWDFVGITEELNIQKEQEVYVSSPIVKTVKSLLERYGGRWSGTSTELLQCGLKETGEPLASTESALARKLNRFDDLFEKDGILHQRPDRNGGPLGRKHTFVFKEKAADYTETEGKSLDMAACIEDIDLYSL